MAESVFASELIDSVRLSLVSGVGPLLRKALLERFGSAAAVLAATKGELQAVDGIGVLTEEGADYPRPLREIQDPPGVLFRRGKPLAQDEMAVAIVGTRHAT